MQIAQKHIHAINLLMLQRMQKYLTIFATDDNDISSLQMYTDDIAYNANALQVFNNSNLRKQDVLNLHNAIMHQDTLVREHFYIVLKYIENNNLIAADYFTCK
jgi:hypothetical protein